MDLSQLTVQQLLELAGVAQSRPSITIAELIPRYMEHAREYYVKHGKPTGEVYRAEIACRALLELYPDTPLSDFGPLKMQALRNHLIGSASRVDRRARTYVNQLCEVIRRMVKWATSQELCPGGVYQALQCVPGLKRGRSKARETEPVKPVAIEVVEATLPHVSPVVAAMIRVQLLCGARPGEVCQVRACDIDTNDAACWWFTPQTHKTEHHGHERRIPFGPQAQEILQPFIDDAEPAEFIFSPRKAEAVRNQHRRDNPRAKLWPHQIARIQKKKMRPEDRERQPADQYTTPSYRRAIERGCEVAFNMPRHLRNNQIYLTCLKLTEPEKSDVGEQLRAEANAWRSAHVWHPNQLRHAAATFFRQRYGIEAASVILGHSSLVITMTYAEADFERAKQVIGEVG